MSSPPPFPNEYEIAFAGLVLLAAVLYGGVVRGRERVSQAVRVAMMLLLLVALGTLLFSLFVRFS
jgi:hypothetical protein